MSTKLDNDLLKVLARNLNDEQLTYLVTSEGVFREGPEPAVKITRATFNAVQDMIFSDAGLKPRGPQHIKGGKISISASVREEPWEFSWPDNIDAYELGQSVLGWAKKMYPFISPYLRQKPWNIDLPSPYGHGRYSLRQKPLKRRQEFIELIKESMKHNARFGLKDSWAVQDRSLYRQAYDLYRSLKRIGPVLADNIDPSGTLKEHVGCLYSDAQYVGPEADGTGFMCSYTKRSNLAHAVPDETFQYKFITKIVEIRKLQTYCGFSRIEEVLQGPDWEKKLEKMTLIAPWVGKYTVNITPIEWDILISMSPGQIDAVYELWLKMKLFPIKNSRHKLSKRLSVLGALA